MVKLGVRIFFTYLNGLYEFDRPWHIFGLIDSMMLFYKWEVFTWL